MHSSEDDLGVLDRSVLVVRKSPSRSAGVSEDAKRLSGWKARADLPGGNSQRSVLVVAEQLGGL